MIAAILILAFALALLLVAFATWYLVRAASLWQDCRNSRLTVAYTEEMRRRQLRDLDEEYARRPKPPPTLTAVPNVAEYPGPTFPGPKGAA